MAKIMTMAVDYTRPWNPNYPYSPPSYWKKIAPDEMRDIGFNRDHRWMNAGLGPNLNSERMPPWLSHEREMEWAANQCKTGTPKEAPRRFSRVNKYYFDPTDNTRPPLIVADFYEAHEVCKMYALYLACDHQLSLDTIRPEDLARTDPTRIKLIEESRLRFEPSTLVVN